MNVKTRFPPSPTGYLHIGGLRTALYNYLFAKKHGGTFVLRIEDTDRTRYVPGAVESMIRVLKTVGLDYDEGPVLNGELIEQKGDNGPYIQSERLDIYKEHANVLLEKGSAYYCFCSSDRLDSLRKQQEIAKLPTKYDRACLRLTPEEIQAKLSANEPFVLRMRIPEGETSFQDLIRGTITFKNAEIDDQILMKSDGYPTYHLANVVDDHLMEITHVIRGEEWLSSVPKHVHLYLAFGWNLPAFAHLPLILNPDHSKLSKRQGDVAVEDFLAKGYLKEALLNFVMLMGFNPKADQEIYSVDELIPLFELEKVNKSGAVFNVEKLNWLNGQYIRTKTPSELAALAKPFLAQAGKSVSDALLEKVCRVEKERLVLLGDIVDKIDLFLGIKPYDASLLEWKKADKTDADLQLAGLLPFVATLPDETYASLELIETAVKGYIEENKLQNGNVLWPLRVSLSGQSASPNPFELLWALGREEAMRRIQFALDLLRS